MIVLFSIQRFMSYIALAESMMKSESLMLSMAGVVLNAKEEKICAEVGLSLEERRPNDDYRITVMDSTVLRFCALPWQIGIYDQDRVSESMLTSVPLSHQSQLSRDLSQFQVNKYSLEVHGA